MSRIRAGLSESRLMYLRARRLTSRSYRCNSVEPLNTPVRSSPLLCSRLNLVRRQTRLVGDPHGTVLEGVHRVLIDHRGVVSLAWRPGCVVRPSGRWILFVGDHAVDVFRSADIDDFRTFWGISHPLRTAARQIGGDVDDEQQQRRQSRRTSSMASIGECQPMAPAVATRPSFSSRVRP